MTGLPSLASDPSEGPLPPARGPFISQLSHTGTPPPDCRHRWGSWLGAAGPAQPSQGSEVKPKPAAHVWRDIRRPQDGQLPLCPATPATRGARPGLTGRKSLQEILAEALPLIQTPLEGPVAFCGKSPAQTQGPWVKASHADRQSKGPDRGATRRLKRSLWSCSGERGREQGLLHRFGSERDSAGLLPAPPGSEGVRNQVHARARRQGPRQGRSGIFSCTPSAQPGARPATRATPDSGSPAPLPPRARPALTGRWRPPDSRPDRRRRDAACTGSGSGPAPARPRSSAGSQSRLQHTPAEASRGAPSRASERASEVAQPSRAPEPRGAAPRPPEPSPAQPSPAQPWQPSPAPRGAAQHSRAQRSAAQPG
ncbi:skin secretory protein xP2-like [Gracilinanus agilis]|uniref:skin secretory protein xP2-like n=1 Tax=Gracilinanus agilis TaxID=191870 RepID=UPI001CFD7D13|nr:skin secretory protein xP2-like [Gracilinanus agilis]